MNGSSFDTDGGIVGGKICWKAMKREVDFKITGANGIGEKLRAFCVEGHV